MLYFKIALVTLVSVVCFSNAAVFGPAQVGRSVNHQPRDQVGGTLKPRQDYEGWLDQGFGISARDAPGPSTVTVTVTSYPEACPEVPTVITPGGTGSPITVYPALPTVITPSGTGPPITITPASTFGNITTLSPILPSNGGPGASGASTSAGSEAASATSQGASGSAASSSLSSEASSLSSATSSIVSGTTSKTTSKASTLLSGTSTAAPTSNAAQGHKYEGLFAAVLVVVTGNVLLMV
ncbi:Mucin-21 [Toensbergia leucococca]|nr:Mucin-21 [Toensbergia leucococca]